MERRVIASLSEPSDRLSTAHHKSAARVLVVLCTYNEADNLPKVFDQLEQVLPEADMLVVDDNSPDGTADVVRSRQESDGRYHLLLRSGKLGLGTALRDAMTWCLERDYDFLINLDADLSHDPARAPALLEACMQPGVEVTLGSRYVPGGGFPGLAWHRRLISWCLNGYATRLLGLPVSDCSGSYRCYRTGALRKIKLSQLTCTGYGFLEEILVALHRSGAHLNEVPIQFECRLNGQSKLSLSDVVGVFKVVHTLAWRRE